MTARSEARDEAVLVLAAAGWSPERIALVLARDPRDDLASLRAQFKAYLNNGSPVLAERLAVWIATA